jgi:hypothetical protein
MCCPQKVSPLWPTSPWPRNPPTRTPSVSTRSPWTTGCGCSTSPLARKYLWLLRSFDQGRANYRVLLHGADGVRPSARSPLPAGVRGVNPFAAWKRSMRSVDVLDLQIRHLMITGGRACLRIQPRADHHQPRRPPDGPSTGLATTTMPAAMEIKGMGSVVTDDKGMTSTATTGTSRLRPSGRVPVSARRRGCPLSCRTPYRPWALRRAFSARSERPGQGQAAVRRHPVRPEVRRDWLSWVPRLLWKRHGRVGRAW